MKEFNFDEALEMVKQGHPVDGKDGVLAPLIKQLVEAALEAEIESHYNAPKIQDNNFTDCLSLRYNTQE
jgi:transposase-like protein